MTTLRIGESTIQINCDVIRNESGDLLFLGRTGKRDANELFRKWRGEYELSSDDRGTVWHQKDHALEKITKAKYQGGGRPSIRLF